MALESKVMREMKNLNGLAPDNSILKKIEKKIKYGKHDINYYRNKYEENMKHLCEFMTSNYMGNIIKQYGLRYIIKPNIVIEECDFIKFVQNLHKQGYVTREHLIDFLAPLNVSIPQSIDFSRLIKDRVESGMIEISNLQKDDLGKLFDTYFKNSYYKLNMIHYG